MREFENITDLPHVGIIFSWAGKAMQTFPTLETEPVYEDGNEGVSYGRELCCLY